MNNMSLPGVSALDYVVIHYDDAPGEHARKVAVLSCLERITETIRPAHVAPGYIMFSGSDVDALAPALRVLARRVPDVRVGVRPNARAAFLALCPPGMSLIAMVLGAVAAENDFDSPKNLVATYHNDPATAVLQWRTVFDRVTGGLAH